MEYGDSMNNSSSRVLAIDMGEKRVGVAISDPLGTSIRQLEHIEASGKKELIERIILLVNEYKPRVVVVGVPVNMDGTIGPMAQKAKKFAAELGKSLEVPVSIVDERLTSREAEHILISADMSRKKRKNVIDGMAAALILEKFLGEEKLRNLQEEDAE
jgi:putative holliday junction resolvase